MSPELTFSAGIALLVLLGWYFGTDNPLRKRLLGTALTIAVSVMCLLSLHPLKEKIRLGLDLQGGTAFLIRLVGGEKQITKSMVDQAVEVIRKRVDQFGVAEPVITPTYPDRILVQIPGLDAAKIQEARDQLSRVAKLEFALVHPQNSELIGQIETGQGIIPPDYRITTYTFDAGDEKKHEEKLLVHRRPDLTGDHIKHAFAGYSNEWEVSLEFDSVGAKRFDDLAAAHFHERFAILLDGVVQSAPSINAKYFGGRAQISGGRMGETEARNLASVLENPLQTPVKIEEERQVSASLGSDSIRSGVYSAIAGIILVAVFMVVYYRLVGFIAIVALLINCIMVLGAMAMFNSVLTLPGIAGLILSLGIAVDANVLIYERLREELDMGKSLKTAVDYSYSKAFSAIFDAHVTQFITAAILYWLATGPVKGFALTLTIGIVASMFSSLLITYTCFQWAFAANLMKRVTMLHLIRAKRFDFLGNARPFVLISTALVIASVAIFAWRGERNFGADFKGGDLLVLSANQKLTPDRVRTALAHTGLEHSTIQSERVADRDLISIRGEYGTADRIKATLSKALPDVGLKFEQTDHIGALIGKELANKSAFALALGLAGIFVYVTFRFETSFAVGSLVALAHDLIITLGIFSLSGRELSLIMVAAILTIAGYSINDKIVVFDRIRSGLRQSLGGSSVGEIMNNSINDTLSRTILTGGTVLLTVLALYFFGGPVLNDFAFSFLVGVIIGTYSSIFIASPIVLWWTRARGGSASSLRREIQQKAAAANPAA
jgi:SecD/SecF fusion protein